MATEQEKAALALLDWYRAMGVDEAVGEVPFDSFAAPQPKPAPRRAPEVKMAASPPRAAPRAARPISTRGIGAEISTLTELEALVAGFEGCALRRTAKSLCFARGSASARIMRSSKPERPSLPCRGACASAVARPVSGGVRSA